MRSTLKGRQGKTIKQKSKQWIMETGDRYFRFLVSIVILSIVLLKLGNG